MGGTDPAPDPAPDQGVAAAEQAALQHARETLRARPAGAQEPPPAAEALRLIHEVLADVTAANGGAGGAGAVTGGADGLDGAADSSDVLAALLVLRHLRETIGGWEPQLIAAARQQGISWASLAPALGVTSRQAAERRYLRLRPGGGGEPTAEARVRAERTRRAGDRAVARWARENSAPLRRLAGRLSALDDLGAAAQQHVDRVQEALGEADPAALLSPLADAHAHLPTSHAALAKEIGRVTEQAENLRRDAQHRRGTP